MDSNFPIIEYLVYSFELLDNVITNLLKVLYFFYLHFFQCASHQRSKYLILDFLYSIRVVYTNIFKLGIVNLPISGSRGPNTNRVA